MPDASLREDSQGLEITNLIGNCDFASRRVRPRDHAAEIDAMHRLVHVFAKSPTQILREFVDVSLHVTGADSSGISLEESLPGGQRQFRWLATAGAYAPFVDAVLPDLFSPCRTCLERNQAQVFRVSQDYLRCIHVPAPPVTDGLLLPWQVDGTRGTIWIVAHRSRELFDLEDFRILQSLAYFAAIAIRQQRQRYQLTEKLAAIAAAEMANDLSRRIHGPLQSLIDSTLLASQGGDHAQEYALEASADALKLSMLLKEILTPPEF